VVETQSFSKSELRSKYIASMNLITRSGTKLVVTHHYASRSRRRRHNTTQRLKLQTSKFRTSKN